MKPEYKRENLKISEFDTEDVIMTLGQEQLQPTSLKRDLENAYGAFNSFNDAPPGSWF